MARANKIPVSFIATRVKKQPMVVNFYTKDGQKVSFEALEKVKTKEGIHFLADPQKLKKR